jgi:hypothetical protein
VDILDNSTGIPEIMMWRFFGRCYSSVVAAVVVAIHQRKVDSNVKQVIQIARIIIFDRLATEGADWI